MFKSLLLVALIAVPISSWSQERGVSPLAALLQNACSENLSTSCPQAHGEREQLKCLMGHKEGLTSECREGLQKYSQVSQQAASRGGGALSALGGMTGLTPPMPMVVFEGRYYPSGQEPEVIDYRINASTPVYRSDKSTLALSTAYGHFQFSEPVVLDSGKQLSKTLRRAEVGAQYTRSLSERRSWGLRGSLGYTGDVLFKNSRDLTFSMAATYTNPTSETSLWIWSVFFSNNSPLGNFIPIPGVMYIHRSENLTWMLGAPIAAIQWTPSYPWSVLVSLFGPTFNSEVSYGDGEGMQWFSGVQWTQQLYLLEDRKTDRERLRIQEMRALVGVRAPLMQKWRGELQLGHSFQRSTYIGEGWFDKEGGAADLPESLFIGTNIRAFF